MFDNRAIPDQLSPFLHYLATQATEGQQLPSLPELSQILGVSTASLREQLEVARAMGIVDVRPRTGIRRKPYSFAPAVLQSLCYAIAVCPENFEAFSDLRNHVEATFWRQAVSGLTPEDHNGLLGLLGQAEEKMNREPVQIPHAEHRTLHLLIYSRLKNPFVTGILEAYWDMYETVGLAFYTDLDYLQTVWNYHRKMVEAICAGDINAGYQALIDHVDLIHQRSRLKTRGRFE